MITRAWDLINMLRGEGFVPRAYSGRHMYGKECVAVDIEDEEDLFEARKIGVPHPSVDQLGKGLIAYWPRFEWPDDQVKL